MNYTKVLGFGPTTGTEIVLLMDSSEFNNHGQVVVVQHV
jgi:hypothetical protein